MTAEKTAPMGRQETMVMTALLMALACIATCVLVIPTPTGGYVNLGDTVVLLGAYLLGPAAGAIAGGFGSALADLMTGYGVYAPGTLVIKALMALTAAGLYKALGKRNGALILCGLAAEVMMIAGYCLYDGLLAGNLAVGLMGIPSNVTQGVFGLAASTLLTMALKRRPYVQRKFPHL